MWFLLGVITGWISMLACLFVISAAMRRVDTDPSVRKIRMQERVVVHAENRNDS